MKRISVHNLRIKCLSDFPNLVSCYYVSRPYIIHNIDTEFKLPKLKRIESLALDDYIRIPKSFEHSLNQLEVVEVKGANMSIEHIIEYLNSNKLKSVDIVSTNSLRLNVLCIIKVKYSKLEPLYLILMGFYSSAENGTNMDFFSSIKLDVEGKLDFGIKWFGDLKNLKSIKLADASNNFLKFDIEYNNMKLIDNSNIEELGYFDLNCSFN